MHKRNIGEFFEDPGEDEIAKQRSKTVGRRATGRQNTLIVGFRHVVVGPGPLAMAHQEVMRGEPCIVMQVRESFREGIAAGPDGIFTMTGGVACQSHGV